MQYPASYTPVAGDTVAYAAQTWPVSSIETVLGQQRAVCSQQRYDGLVLTPSFQLDKLTLASSASGAPFFTTAPGGGNTGSGAINAGTVVDGTRWIRDTYTVTFTSTSAYEVKDSGDATIVTGSYSNPTTIAFLGVTVTISGAPAANDTFTLTPAAP